MPRIEKINGARGSKFLRFWFPLFLYSGIIFFVSSLPDLKTPFEGFNFDKVVHFCEYTPFGLLLSRALYFSRWGLGSAATNRKLLLMTVVGALLYAISDEFHQSFVPGRDSSPFDAMADTLGGCLGAYLYLFKFRKLFKAESG